MTNEEKALKQLLELKSHLISKMSSGNFALHPQNVLQEVNKVINTLNEPTI